MLSTAGTFCVVSCFCFVLVFKSTAVQTLYYLFIIVFVSQHMCCD